MRHDRVNEIYSPMWVSFGVTIVSDGFFVSESNAASSFADMSELSRVTSVAHPYSIYP